ncbi:MAG: polysaccharide deacetylase family protein, partial [Planctomycetota bacterium]
LGVLGQHGVKATFFPIGANVKGREDVLRAIHAAGHTIGSHSFAHSRLTNFLLAGAMTAEVDQGVKAVEAVIGKRPRLYRPPIGLKSPSVAAACRRLGLVCIGWRRRVRDGGATQPDVAKLVARLVAAKGGEIVLLHDGVEPGRKGDREATIKALREAIPLLKARGLSFATVDQLLGEKPYA